MSLLLQPLRAESSGRSRTAERLRLAIRSIPAEGLSVPRSDEEVGEVGRPRCVRKAGAIGETDARWRGTNILSVAYDYRFERGSIQRDRKATSDIDEREDCEHM